MSVSLPELADNSPAFRRHEDVRTDLIDACASVPDDLARHVRLGDSVEGRPLDGFVVGRGAASVSLIAGNHADEPVGPETLRSLVLALLDDVEAASDLLSRVQLCIVPHTNPDGEVRNRTWMEAWPDLETYARHVVREEPGRDLEFGFPSMRPENEAVSAFMRAHAPFALHASLHGMAASEGALLLINRPWTFRTEALQSGYVAAAEKEGLRMHDHNRKGEKGFFWIDRGFQTTPRGDAMRAFFEAKDDPEMAAKFHDSSMEYAMRLGGDPLALVTELPLFVVRNDDPTPGVPEHYLELKARLPEIKLRLSRDESVDDLLKPFDVRPLPLAAAMRIQARTIELALETVLPNDAER